MIYLAHLSAEIVMLKIETRSQIPLWQTILANLLAIAVALSLGAVLLKAAGIDPSDAYRRMLQNGFLETYSLSDTLIKATPLLFAGLGVSIAFRMKLWNIGAEGQLLFAAWATAGCALYVIPASTPSWLFIPCLVLIAFAAGAFWGAIPGVLKAKLGVNEIISSLMLVYIADLLIQFFVYGQWGAGGFPLTAKIPPNARLPRLLDFAATFPVLRGMTAHLGFVLGIVVAIVLWVLFRQSKWGYELNVIGDNPRAAHYSGMNIGRMVVLSMILSGGLAGLAGLSEISGVIHRLQENVSPGYGFSAIIIAWLARLNPLALILVAYLFGGVLVGADALPEGIALLLQGILLFCVISADLFTRYQIRWLSKTQS